MYYTDYSTARLAHNYKHTQFTQAVEADRLARQSRDSSPTLKGLAMDKLGNGLISMGKLLKGSSISSQNTEPCR